MSWKILLKINNILNNPRDKYTDEKRTELKSLTNADFVNLLISK